MPVDIFGRSGNSNRSEQNVYERNVCIDTKSFVRYDGVTQSLNMGGNSLKNLPFPDELLDAVNRRFVEEKINHLDEALRQYIDEAVKKAVAEALEVIVPEI